MSYLALLSGMAEGAGGEVAKQAEFKRQSQNQNNQLLADSINKRLETDDTLDWPSYSSLRGQEYKLRGMKPDQINQMLQNEQPLWNRHQQLKQSGLQTNPQGGYTSPQATQNPDGTASTNLQFPGNPPTTPSLGNVPTPEGPGPVTAGERKANEKANAYNIETDAILRRQQQQLGLIGNGQGSNSQNIQNNGSVETSPTTHMKTRSAVGPNGVTASQEAELPKVIPSAVYGGDILKEFPQAKGVEETSWYRRGQYSDGEVSHYPTTPYGVHKLVLYDPTSATHASEVEADAKGNIISPPVQGVAAPPSWSEKDTERQGIVWKTDPNTGEIKPYITKTAVKNAPQVQTGGVGTGSSSKTVTPASPLPSPPAARVGSGPDHGGTTVPKNLSNAPLSKPFNPSDPVDNVIQMAGSDSQLADKEFRKLKPSDQRRYESRLAELGVTPNNVTNSIRERAILAKGVLSHLNTINSLIDQADKDGDLGTVAKTWNDFLTNGKIGTDTTKNQIFSQLSSQYGFLTTAAAMAHGGLRGGSSPSMVEHWEHTLDAKDPATMKAKLKSLTQWMETYASMVPDAGQTVGGGGRGATPQTKVPSGPSGSVVDSLVDKYK